MRKNILTAFLIFCAASLFSCPFSAWAQGQEYLRTRAGSLAATSTSTLGDMESLIEYFIAPGDSMEIIIWQSSEARTAALPKEKTSPSGEYLIVAGDILEVFVWQNPDLTKDVIVGPDGDISYPLVGRIQAAGLTVSQLEEKLKEQISKFVRYPQVSLMVKQFAEAESGSKDMVIILDKDAVVGPDGKISYPLVGRIKAANLTIGQLEKKIRSSLPKSIKYPQVSVMMKEFAGNKIIILGDVIYPGIYTYSGKLNLMEAIALAGDFNAKARRDSVMVVRGRVNENPQVLRIDMLRIIKKGISDQNIELMPNDFIYVPRTFVSNFKDFMKDMGDIAQEANNMIDTRTRVRTQIQGHRR